MGITKTQAKSILNKHKRVDSWFVIRYGMNLYRGCAHNCAYCDGRAEGYYVEGDFGKDILAKTNAPVLLDAALDPRRKRTPLKRGFIGLCGGVSDAYQPAEKNLEITQQVLQVILKRRFPVHVLTKSSLIERDLNLLADIDEQSKTIVSMSFSGVDDKISRIFEPGCTPPSKRLQTLTLMKEHGIATGMFLLPVIPGITDKPELIEQSVQQAKEAGIDFVVFGGMTLKEGRQKRHFLDVVKKHDPTLLPGYQKVFPGHRQGMGLAKYYERLENRFFQAADKYNVPTRMPIALFENQMSETDKITVILDHIDYALKSKGRTSNFALAAHHISKQKRSLAVMKSQLSQIKGVDAAVEKEITELLETGQSPLYQTLFPNRPTG